MLLKAKCMVLAERGFVLTKMVIYDTGATGGSLFSYIKGEHDINVLKLKLDDLKQHIVLYLQLKERHRVLTIAVK